MSYQKQNNFENYDDYAYSSKAQFQNNKISLSFLSDKFKKFKILCGHIYRVNFKRSLQFLFFMTDRRFIISPGSFLDPLSEVQFDKYGGQIFIKEGSWIGPRVLLSAPTRGRMVIGRFVSINADAQIHGLVDIGSYSILASNIYISSGLHNFRKKPWDLIRNQDQLVDPDSDYNEYNDGRVEIGEDVWIGRGVYISRGVKIGRGAVIGANSVVLKDVPPYAVVAGSPAKRISSRLDYNPPADILHENPEHIPYFNAGFKQLHQERSKLGLEVEARYFSVALKGLQRQVLRLIFFPGPTGAVTIFENKIEIGRGEVNESGVCEVVLARLQSSCSDFSFYEVICDCTSGSLFLQSAHIN